MTDIEKQKGVYFLIHRSSNFVFVYYSNDIDKQYERMKKKLNKNEFKAATLQEYWNQDREQSFIFIKQYIDDEDIIKARTEKWINWFRNEGVQCEHLLLRTIVKPEWEILRDRYRKYEALWEGNLDLRAGIRDIKSELDYSLEFAEERTTILKQVFKKHDPWLTDYISSLGFINKQVKTKSHVLTEKDMYGMFMTSVVDYVAFPDYKNKYCKENKIKYDEQILSDNKNGTNIVRELLVSDITEVDEERIVKTESRIRSRQDNYKLIVKQTINEQDRKEFPELDRYYRFMVLVDSKLKQAQKARHKSRAKFYKDMKKELAKDIAFAKDHIRGTIYFKRFCGDSTEFNFDSDTGYFDDRVSNRKLQFGDYKLVSQNKIEFSNPLHIFAIMDNYSTLRESCYESPDSDLWAILHDFDNLVESTPLEVHMKDVLIMKIDGISGKDICEEINSKHNMQLTDDNLTKLYKRIIPNIISEKYIEMYDEWFYTFKAKGKYKTCNNCNNTKLLTIRYFGKRSDNKGDGYFNICKECDKVRKNGKNIDSTPY